MEEEHDTRVDPHVRDTNFKEIEIVAYIGEFRIVGVAHFGVGMRASSRRASDYIRAFGDARLTLSNVRIYNKATRELVDTAPFILLNMDKVDFLYGRDEVSPAEQGTSEGATGA
jgi:hypothetical protein